MIKWPPYFKFSQLLWVLGFGLVFFAAWWTLLRPGFFPTDDGEWMIIRLTAFFQSLREGQLPVRFLGRLNHGYGYPVANFLYPGFLYLGSVIHAAGFSYVSSIKIILIGSILTGSWFIYGWLRTWYSRGASFLGLIAFTWAPYLLFDVYERGSVGEVLGIAAAAGALYSFEKVGRMTPLFLALLIVSHNTVAALFVAFFLGFAWVRGRGREGLTHLLWGLGMTIWFWGPAIFERRYVRFDAVEVSQPLEYLFHGSEWLLVGLPVFLAIWLVTLSKRVKYDQLTRYMFLVVLVVVFLVSPISFWFWNLRLSALVIQFPYRLLAISLLAGSFLTAAWASRIKSKVIWSLVLIGFFVIGPFVYTRNLRQINRPDEYYSTNEATTTVANEYLPKWMAAEPTYRAVARIEFFSGRGTILWRGYAFSRLSGTIKAEEDSVLQVNTVYYPGWGVLINGQPAKISYDNPNGVIRFELPAGTHDFFMAFHETPLRLISDGISLVFLLTFGWKLVLSTREGIAGHVVKN